MKDYSNFHNIDTDSRIQRNGERLLNVSLNSYGSKEVLLNDTITTRISLTQKYDGNGEVRRVTGRIEDLKRGNLFLIDDLYWLVTTFPEANQVYAKADITLCNETLKLVTGTTKTRTGTDALGRPIYSQVDQTDDVPIVFNSKAYNIIDNSAISLPDDYADIMIQYVEGRQLPTINSELKFNNNLYKVTSLEFQKVIKGQGIVEIRLERQVNA